MSFDLQRILDSKRAFRQRLATRPIAEKLRMLDELRERTLALRTATVPPALKSPSPPRPGTTVREVKNET